MSTGHPDPSPVLLGACATERGSAGPRCARTRRASAWEHIFSAPDVLPLRCFAFSLTRPARGAREEGRAADGAPSDM